MTDFSENVNNPFTVRFVLEIDKITSGMAQKNPDTFLYPGSVFKAFALTMTGAKVRNFYKPQ